MNNSSQQLLSPAAAWATQCDGGGLTSIPKRACKHGPTPGAAVRHLRAPCPCTTVAGHAQTASATSCVQTQSSALPRKPGCCGSIQHIDSPLSNRIHASATRFPNVIALLKPAQAVNFPYMIVRDVGDDWALFGLVIHTRLTWHPWARHCISVKVRRRRHRVGPRGEHRNPMQPRARAHALLAVFDNKLLNLLHLLIQSVDMGCSFFLNMPQPQLQAPDAGLHLCCRYCKSIKHIFRIHDLTAHASSQ